MIKDIEESKSIYEYDKLGRLIEEVHPNGDVETFTYDENGNILFHQVKNKNGVYTANEKYNYSTTIKDQLVSISSAVSKSTIREYKYEGSYKGNPTTIIKDGVSQTLTWEGRKLKQIGTQVSYTYNEDGIRIKKLGSNYVETYTLDGSNIIGLHRDSEGGSYDMYFNYDEQGEIVGLNCEGKEYFYVRDITGNIMKIIDEDGYCVVSYTYDAWGNFKKTIYRDNYVSHRNPFVYKGYFYDEETGWFYLKSRYYDPSIRRFINADDFTNLEIESLNGVNLYCYCQNNPVMYKDPNGQSFILACIIVGAIVGAIAGGIYAYNTAKENGAEGWELFGWTMLGIIGGGLLGGLIGGTLGYFAGMSFSTTLPTGFALMETSTGMMTLVATGTIEITITGAQVISAVAALGTVMMFAKDSFVEKLKRGMSQKQKEMFQREIEDYKKQEGRGGKDNLIKEILREIAELIKSSYK